MPWIARPTSSAPTSPANPATSEPAARTAQPLRKIRRAPKRSDKRPPRSSSPPNATTYALNTQLRSWGEKPRSAWISGRATPMIEVSMMTMNWAAAISPSASQRRLLRPPAAWGVVDMVIPLSGWTAVVGDVQHLLQRGCRRPVRSLSASRGAPTAAQGRAGGGSDSTWTV